jgi:hypothetical protein
LSETVRLFSRPLGDFGLGAVKTAELIPSSAGGINLKISLQYWRELALEGINSAVFTNHTNRAERCTNAAVL